MGHGPGNRGRLARMTLLTQYPGWIMVLSGLLSAVVACLMAPLAHKLGWVDHPDLRKLHEAATPMTGGVAVYAAIAVGLALRTDRWSGTEPFLLWLLLGGLGLLLLGLIDDLRDLSAPLRFVLQSGICLLMIHFAGVRLDDFGQLFGNGVLRLGWLAVPITVFAALGVINAFNLIDGMDGLAGGIFVVAAGGMAGFAFRSGDSSSGFFLLLAVAAVVGFLALNAPLPWNHKARMFLGNSGSLFLGFLLAWCFIRLGNGDQRAFMPMTAVWLFAIPLLDTTTSMWLRWRDGRSPFSADRVHLHHAFLRAGFSVAQTWLAIILLALLMAGVGALFEFARLPAYPGFYLFMAFALAYCWYMKHSWAAQRFLGRHFIHHDFSIDAGYADLKQHNR